MLSQLKAEIATACAITLMLLNANHVLIVPGEAITLITSVYLGGSAIVHGARAIGAGLTVRGMSNITDLPAKTRTGEIEYPPAVVAQIQTDQLHQAKTFQALSKGEDPTK